MLIAVSKIVAITHIVNIVVAFIFINMNVRLHANKLYQKNYGSFFTNLLKLTCMFSKLYSCLLVLAWFFGGGMIVKKSNTALTSFKSLCWSGFAIKLSAIFCVSSPTVMFKLLASCSYSLYCLSFRYAQICIVIPYLLNLDFI